MGFTLPRKYGGLNCPNLVYTMANEIVSRADASLMNIFGLQGIAETINAFANDEIKDEYLPRFARGEVTGAMVLTEPDAGSDLQAVRLKAVPGRTTATGFSTASSASSPTAAARSCWCWPAASRSSKDGRGLSLFVDRPQRAHQGAPPGAQARHPRLAHLRAGLRRRPGAGSSASGSAV